MTKTQIAALAKGLAPVLRDFFAEVLARVDAKARGLDGKDGARGPEGPEGKPGRDGRDGQPGVQGEKGLDGTNGKEGLNGLGFDDLSIVHDGERHVTLRFIKGDQIREFSLKFPVPIYRGIYEPEKAYETGDSVTFANQQWIARDETREKPGTGKAWQLAVRAGREGREGKQGPSGPKGPKGDPGGIH
jgi:integrin beta 3